MADGGSYKIEVGEHGILGAAAHLSVRLTDDSGNRIVEINGLATKPGEDPSAMGSALTGHDIQGHLYWGGDPRSFFGLQRTRSVDTLDEKPISELRGDLETIQEVVDAINSKSISYQALNTNSNSVAMTVLRSLGYTVEDVRAITTRLTPGLNIDLLSDAEIEAIMESVKSNNHCFVSDTPITMWPTDRSLKPREDGSYDEELVLAKVWQKPISEVSASDLVVSYDENGRICPGPVTRTMRNGVKHVLDFWGTGVTPGHAYFCADGKFKGQHVPLLDILRTDGTIMKSDGTQIRAATGCEVGSIHDRLIHAVVGDKQPDGQIAIREQGQVRLGTRVILENGEQHCVLDILNANGAQITEDGYIRSGAGGAKVPLSWTFSEQLPKPEDYILKRSKVTLEEIYAAGEWEQIGPRLPAPDGSKASPQHRKATPVGSQTPLAAADGMRQPTRTLNRKQRKAMEAKQRKAAKGGKRLVS